MKIFISYASVDDRSVRELVKILRYEHEPWYDHWLLPGQNWKSELIRQITSCDIFVYCLTPESVASEWCQWEFKEAAKLGKPILPILLQKKTKIPDVIMAYHYCDLSDGPTGDPVARLLAGINRINKEIQNNIVPDAPENPAGKPSRVRPLDLEESEFPSDNKNRNDVNKFVEDESDESSVVSKAIIEEIVEKTTQIEEHASISEVEQSDSSDEQDELVVDKDQAEVDEGLPEKVVSNCAKDNRNFEPAKQSRKLGQNEVTSDRATNIEIEEDTTNNSESISVADNSEISEEKNPVNKTEDSVFDNGCAILLNAFFIIGFIILLSQNKSAFSSQLQEAKTLAQDGQYELAISKFDELLEQDSGNSEVFVERGNVYYTLGNFREALNDYNSAIAISPSNADYYNNRAGIFAVLGMHSDALHDYTKAIELRPEDTTYYLNRGLFEQNIGLNEEARNDFEAIADYCNRIGEASSLYSRSLTCAIAFENLGLIDSALSYYREYADSLGDDPPGWLSDTIANLEAEMAR